MIIRFVLALGVLLALGSGAARAQTLCSPAISTWDCINILLGGQIYSGGNEHLGQETYPVCQITDAATVTINAAACPVNTNGTSLVTINLTQNTTMAFPSNLGSLGGWPVDIRFVQPSSGGPYTVTFASGWTVPSAATQIGLSAVAGEIDHIVCDSWPSTASYAVNGMEMDCGGPYFNLVSSGGGSGTGFTVGTMVEGGATGQFQTAVSITGVPITSGHMLVVLNVGCASGSGCGSTNTPSAPTSVAVSGGTGSIGTCGSAQLMTGAGPVAVSAGLLSPTGIFYCSITASGTANLTVTVPSSDYPHSFAVDVGGIAASPDEGIGHSIASTTGTAVGASSNGTTTNSSNFVIALASTGAGPATQSGWTQALLDSSNNLVVAWQANSGTGNSVGGTTTFSQSSSAPWAATIGVLK